MLHRPHHDELEDQAVQKRRVVYALVVASAFSALVISTPMVMLTGPDFALIAPFTFIVSLLAGAIFGLPCYILARKLRIVGWFTALLSGLFISFSMAWLLVHPQSPSEQARDALFTIHVDDGAARLQWLGQLGIVASITIAGGIAGLWFWAVLTRSLLKLIKQRRFDAPLLLVLSLTLLAVPASARLQAGPADHSCHNPLKDGMTSVAPVATFNMAIPRTQWLQVYSVLHNFADHDGWSEQSDIAISDEFPWFQVSLCRPSGTDIRTDLAMGSLFLTVYQPQGGKSWRVPFRTLQARLRALSRLRPPDAR